MRSSDIWLGVPYDVVTFSCLSHYVIALLIESGYKGHLVPGTLYNTAASRHLYSSNYDEANALIDQYNRGEDVDTDDMSKNLWLFTEKPSTILDLLDSVATDENGDGFLDLLS
jgi:thymidylate synthase